MAKQQKKTSRSLFYRISAWLHLWLGLISGIVVVVVSLTAAALSFEHELRVWLQPYQTVADTGKEFLPPSVLSQAVKDKYGFPSVYAVSYQGRTRSAIVPYYANRKDYQVVYVNPYTAEVLHNQHLNDDFFRIMLMGHYQLWLPRNIGKPVVAYSTLIFVITLVTGLVLWWPKKWTSATRNRSFFLNFKASLKRINYDLHNVLGFYALLVALVLGLTGMVYGMKWFSDTVYWVGSGGQTLTLERPVSDTTLLAQGAGAEEDVLFTQLQRRQVDLQANNVSITYPFSKAGAWGVEVNPKPGTRFLAQTDYYEQHSLKKLHTKPPFPHGNGGDKLMQLNYDLHVGSIGGIWTKIIAFLACIISGSLPITGFIVWWGKKKKGKLRGKKERMPENRELVTADAAAPAKRRVRKVVRS
ncbi:PepSY domain-containing protein [Pontibacter qinzhouensis]|uniref:PepSY domain-containing protein n=1 Tax=Pontibacter qinzhouensis TaxID=2603253 RepID=A0A5C8K9U9_9BACT|nr:PepSY-associated TM helix domain-containing protein [Pontibacter qinzhouensis]TXK51572.1 PepSY domain-containing protein [Pontibacter qinzhouensis]